VSVIAENVVPVDEAADTETTGRGVRRTNATGLRPAGYRDGDDALWEQSFGEARGRGAGENVARFYADETLRYLRVERDGIEIAGRRDFQAYR
jgi:hypothetical protein